MAVDLQTLRLILGLPVDEVARLAGIPAAEVEAAEARGDDGEAARRILEAFGLSVEAAADRAVAPADEGGHRFFFKGDHTVIEAADLAPLAAGLRWGRLWAASARSADAQRRRRAFAPVPVEGAHAKAAARQGYRLARFVRRSLGLGDGRLDDPAALCEQTFGVPVTAAEFESAGLRAAAIVAPERTAAGIVVRAPQPDEGARVRIDIAHELCHALFDPLPAGRATFALDHEARPEAGDLTEPRARGFAAELLVPLAGLRRVLGPPGRGGGLGRATDLVTRCCDAFGASHTLVSYHLHNHGYFDRVTLNRLLDVAASRWPTSAPVPVELPRPGEPPRCVSRLLDAGAASGAEGDVALARQAGAAWDAARDAWVAETIAEAFAACEAGAVTRGGLILSRAADKALRGDDRGFLAALFAAVEAAPLAIWAVRALLVNTRAAGLVLDARERLIDAVCRAAREEGEGEEEIAALRRRLT